MQNIKYVHCTFYSKQKLALNSYTIHFCSLDGSFSKMGSKHIKFNVYIV